MRRFRHFSKVALLALVTSVGAWVLPAGALADGGPVNQTPPSITGTPQEGSLLTETPGTWGVTLPASETVQWEDCTDSTATTCTSIQGAPTAPGSSYTLGPGDVGAFIVVVETVTETNTSASASASSAPTALVTTTSTTGLIVSPQPSVTNQTVTLTGTVTAGPGSVAPSGTLAFLNGGTPISGCDHVPVSPTGQSVTTVCQTTLGASVAQLSAVFTPSPGSAVAGSASAVDALSVGRDSTVTALFVPGAIVAGEPTTFIAQVSPPAVRPGPLDPTGTVEFLDGGKPVAGCLAQPIGPTGATCAVTYLSTGTRTITARYPVGSGSTTRSRFVLAANRASRSAVCCRRRLVPAKAVRPDAAEAGYRLLSDGRERVATSASRLDAPTTPRCDGGGHDGGLGNGRGAGGDGLGHHRGLGNRGTDDADPSYACWSEGHFQSPSVVAAWSASIEAMIA